MVAIDTLGQGVPAATPWGMEPRNQGMCRVGLKKLLSGSSAALMQMEGLYNAGIGPQIFPNRISGVWEVYDTTV